jgi:hypothetical protein
LRLFAARREDSPKGLRAAECEFQEAAGFRRKEFWIAYIQSVGSQGAHGPAV